MKNNHSKKDFRGGMLGKAEDYVDDILDERVRVVDPRGSANLGRDINTTAKKARIHL